MPFCNLFMGRPSYYSDDDWHEFDVCAMCGLKIQQFIYGYVVECWKNK